MANGDAKDQVPEAMTGGIAWDTESKHELLNQLGKVRENSMYLTVSLTTAMEKTWRGILAYIKTSTDKATGEVTIAKATKSEPGAVQVRRYGTQNAAMFNFWRPLRKLDLTVPADRQFNVTPFTREIPGVGTVFVFPMNDRVSVPRNLKEEQSDSETAEKAKTEAAAKSAKTEAAPAKEPPVKEAPAPETETPTT